VGSGARVDIYRPVGFATSQLNVVASFVERMVQYTTLDECIERYALDCKPGIAKAYTPKSCWALYALLDAANAALVAAEREAANGRLHAAH
jgi:hypothetical protein